MGIEGQSFELNEEKTGPTWARTNWPLHDTDALTAALDPTQMTPDVKAALTQVAKAEKAATGAATGTVSEADVSRAADDSIRAQLLIRTYRVRGHLASNLDPLGLVQRDLPADLTPEYHGF